MKRACSRACLGASWRASLRAIAVFTLLAASLTSSPVHAQGKRSVALVSFGDASSLELDVRAAIERLTTVTLKDAQATAADVAAARELGTSCTGESAECFASLAVLLHVDAVVIATSSAPGVLEMAVVDAALGKESARQRASGLDDVGGRAARLRDAVELLLEPTLHFGTVVVQAPPTSSIAIDGAPAVDGRARVRAGKHRVVVEQAGHEPFSADVNVLAGAESTVVAQLVPHPVAAPPVTSSPGLSGGWIIAASGAGVALAGGAVALGIDAGLGAGLGSADEKEGYQAMGVVALVVAGTGAAVAVFGAALALLVSDS
jgi:hypothetical protein